ncbi:hypothetical protein AAMO2058_000797700 [Amorphochlora amoebiformis]
MARPTWDPYGWFGTSLLTYNFVTPLIERGNSKALEQEDLPQVLEEDSAEEMDRRLTKAWEAQKARKDGSVRLWWAMIVAQDFWYIIFLIISGVGKVSAAVSLGFVVDFFVDSNNRIKQGMDPEWQSGCLRALLLIACISVGALGQHVYFFYAWRRGMNMRTSVMSLIFNHILTTRVCSLGRNTVGHVVNLASNDVQRFAQATMFFPYLVYAPVISMVVIVILWFELGYGALAGFGVLVCVFLPLQFLFSQRYAALRLKAAHQTDHRVKLMNEVITGSRVMKCYAFEGAFEKLVNEIRHKEIKEIKRTATLRGLNEGVYSACPAVVGLVMFGVHVAVGGVLDVRKVFVALTMIIIIKLDLTKFFAFAVKECSEALVAADRIQDFLHLSETPNIPTNTHNTPSHQPSNPSRNISNVISRSSEISLRKTGSVVSTVRASRISSTVELLRPDSSLPGPKSSKLPEKIPETSKNSGVTLRDVTATWDTGRPEGFGRKGRRKMDMRVNGQEEKDGRHVFALRRVTLHIPDEGLVGVVGPVGHGKTSLLMALAGELMIKSGSISFGTKYKQKPMAFVGQEPWILSASIRDNILFGSQFDSERYEQTLSACALNADLKQLPAGDKSLVGEKGIMLSGGQRARIALARAAYAKTPLILLDDPLSAVDPKVAAHLFDNCIKGMMRGRSRILVTHQLQFAKRLDSIAVVQDGQVKAQGTYEEICSQGLEVKEFLMATDVEEAKSKPKSTPDSFPPPEDDSKLPKTRPLPPPRPKPSGEEINGKDVSEMHPSAEQEAEDRETGSVTWNTFTSYVLATGPIPMLVVLSTCVATGEVLLLVVSWYFGEWAESSRDDQASAELIGPAIGLSTLSLVWCSFRSVWMLVALVGASQTLHNRMFARLLRLPIRFFDINPSGRILNRFSKDLGSADDIMPATFFDALSIFFRVSGVVFLVCVINPFVLVIILPLLYGFRHFQKRYMNASREVKRLEAMSRSPIYSLISETLGGMVPLRTYHAQERFRNRFHSNLNRNVEGFFAFICTARWLGLRLDVLTIIFTIFVIYGGIFMLYVGFEIEAGLIGLSLVYLVQLGDAFQWCIRQFAEFENQLVSVERILSYVRRPTEAPLKCHKADVAVPQGWPNIGEVEFRYYSTRYAESLPLVLRDISFKVPGGSKVAIVGRTGAGKSTMVQALFRLIEPTKLNSIRKPVIAIDGVDITLLGLHKARRAMAVIPQTPWLFSGTLRSNLDPFDDYEDANLWGALRDVQLEKSFASLSTPISESGGNLSTGEKQLICLARASLRNSKVLVCDEATAHVDPHTDATIQAAIRRRFSGCTVIIIAHRLNTIIDCDYAAVLEHGRLVEFGPPHDLLKNKEGKFAGMVRDTGVEEEKRLREAAWIHWNERAGKSHGSAGAALA